MLILSNRSVAALGQQVPMYELLLLHHIRKYFNVLGLDRSSTVIFRFSLLSNMNFNAPLGSCNSIKNILVTKR